MKKLYLFLALILMAGSISAQRMVQGVLRSDLPAEKQKAALMSARSNRTFSFDSIDFWVGDGENRAAIVLTWHDTDKTVPDNMVWGYRWSADVDTISGLSLFESVMKADPRLVGLVQYTGSMGYTINGIGYCEPRATSMQISFQLDSAKAHVSYTYPDNAATLARTAINQGKSSGVIYHHLVQMEQVILLMIMTIGWLRLRQLTTGSLVGIPVIGVISFVIPILKISLIPDTGHQAEKSRMVLGMLGAGIVLWERHREQNRVII